MEPGAPTPGASGSARVGLTARHAAGDAAPPARHIVVGIDNTQGSKDALEWAVKHLYRPGDWVHLLHAVREPGTLHFNPGMFAPPDDTEERAEFREAEMFVRAAFSPILRVNQVPSELHIVVAPEDPDSVAAALLAKAGELQELAALDAADDAAAAAAGAGAARWPRPPAAAPAGAEGAAGVAREGAGGSGGGACDSVVIVVASHGRPRLEEFFTGSVCARLLRTSRFPLIVHRGARRA
ncbi:MAG: hypothetical protein J3K34DRAFT_526585 [Monoraphidium minutum]|nr:MAG: hypothetical protein J3K34DRAFT_526585 [Monoraphidium minutum]